jgi:hypothetical protein
MLLVSQRVNRVEDATEQGDGATRALRQRIDVRRVYHNLKFTPPAKPNSGIINEIALMVPT